ncbi:TonB C-terminal domain-containing protein [Halomonas sp. KO116]|uniref:TonB C-terminal domain-containing protein n=1 Tax=Halomonas sp. KO116 TaxID=1504981 RepID=UPI0004E3A4D3|nr:TonB C-terminal domain-containing protein [Halomonas sp. KO116]AJY53326.1 TonB domain-containing protein [Halomonas sp. KO116]
MANYRPKRPKLSKPSGTKQWIQYGIVAVFIGGGLYLNFSGNRDGSSDNESDQNDAHALPVSKNANEEPRDSSLLPPVYNEDDIAEMAGDVEDDNSALSPAPRLAGSTLDQYNPTDIWLDESEKPNQEQDEEVVQTLDEEPTPELGEMAEHSEATPGYVDNLNSVSEVGAGASLEPDNAGEDASGAAEVLPGELPVAIDQSVQPNATMTDANPVNGDGSTVPAASELASDIERLALNRNRIEQTVRRGQIPRSQRDEILRSEDFNSVIAAIGRRVGEAWYYEGEDHAEHGAILSIELGSGGATNKIRIRRSSGNESYNNSVLAAAKDSAPFVEVDRLTSTAKTLLNPFSLTFGSMESIEAYESTWTRQEAIDATDDDEASEHSIENRTVALIKRTMRNHWPADLKTGVDHDISLQVTLAVPMGNVADIEFLRPSNNVDLNDQIYQLVRNMPAFQGLSGLSLQEQNEARQFNLHVSPDGSLR